MEFGVVGIKQNQRLTSVYLIILSKVSVKVEPSMSMHVFDALEVVQDSDFSQIFDFKLLTLQFCAFLLQSDI